MRGAGGPGGVTTVGAARRTGATGAGGADEAAIGDAAGGTTAGGAGVTTRGVAGGVNVAGAGGFSAGTTTTGAGVGAGAMTGAAGVAGGAGLVTGGATAAGFATTGGTTGLAGAGGATVSFRCVIAFSTSPGREMFDRSILVLISSSPRSERALFDAAAGASAEPRMWARTLSASWSSSELECVFFSVTPTRGSVSRMALLFTSSSLARSLIRTLLIRPFFSPRCA